MHICGDFFVLISQDMSGPIFFLLPKKTWITDILYCIISTKPSIMEVIICWTTSCNEYMMCNSFSLDRKIVHHSIWSSCTTTIHQTDRGPGDTCTVPCRERVAT
jgi:hypothetical protein